jgi:hypothetical protein
VSVMAAPRLHRLKGPSLLLLLLLLCARAPGQSLKRTEKFLCAVAGGRWVLRPSFLEAAVRGAFAIVHAAPF